MFIIIHENHAIDSWRIKCNENGQQFQFRHCKLILRFGVENKNLIRYIVKRDYYNYIISKIINSNTNSDCVEIVVIWISCILSKDLLII